MALITLAHGSRHAETSAVMDRLCMAAGKRLGEESAAAYLELQSPSLTEVVSHLAAAGHRQATVVPLLFTQAYHARHDVPAVFQEASSAGLDLTLAPPLGLGNDIADLLAQVVAEDVSGPAHLVLWAVGSSDEAANRQVEALGSAVAERAGYPLSTLFATRGGVAALNEIAQREPRVHLLPLFVAPGLLLDLALNSGCTFTHSEPLGSRLAEVVAHRYTQTRRAA